MSLRQISEVELRNETSPRVFCLQKIVEITSYNMGKFKTEWISLVTNMDLSGSKAINVIFCLVFVSPYYHNCLGRIRLVWNKIWSILSDFFVKAGVHSNLQVSLFVVDSIRQLAMKFLEKDELAAYQFQKQFFKPFELIMAANTNADVRELIVQCLQRMIASKVHNIKSGWRAVFVVLTCAAKTSQKSLVTSSFELLIQCLDLYFHLITDAKETLDECVNCLVAFGCNDITDVALRAIQRLQTVADYLGEQQQNQTNESITAARKLSVDISTNSNNNNNPSNVSTTISTPTLTSVTSLSGEVKHSALPLTAHSSSLAGMGGLSGTASYNSASSSSLRVWFLLLTGLSRMVGDRRIDVRSKALDGLFRTLHKHGHLFGRATWRAIFHGVLFPIFDDVRHIQDQKSTPVILIKKDNNNLQQSNNSGTTLTSTNNTTATDVKPTTTAGIPSTPTASNTTPPSKSSTTKVVPTTKPVPVVSQPQSQPSNLMNNNSFDLSWLQTTCYKALHTLVELFHHFHSIVSFLLPELLSLITSCIDSDNEDLAKIGLKCLVVLCTKCGLEFSVSHWWSVLDAIMDALQRTLPHQLVDEKLRQQLGLSNRGVLVQHPIIAQPTNTNIFNEKFLVSSSPSNQITTSSNTNSSQLPPDVESPAEVTSAANSTATETNHTNLNNQNNSTNTNTLDSTPLSTSGSNTAVTALSTSNSNSASTLPSLPATASSPPLVLPFSNSSILVRCRTTLLLLDSLDEIVQRFFPVRPTPDMPFPIQSQTTNNQTETFPEFVDPFHSLNFEQTNKQRLSITSHSI